MLTKLLCCDCRRRASIPNTVTKMMEKVCFVIGTWLHVLQKKLVKYRDMLRVKKIRERERETERKRQKQTIRKINKQKDGVNN